MTAEERRLIRLLRNRFRDDDAVLGTLLDYLAGRGEAEPAKEPEQWPQVGDRVRTDQDGNGVVTGLYDMESLPPIRMADVTLDDGRKWNGDVRFLAPAPPEPAKEPEPQWAPAIDECCRPKGWSGTYWVHEATIRNGGRVGYKLRRKPGRDDPGPKICWFTADMLELVEPEPWRPTVGDLVQYKGMFRPSQYEVTSVTPQGGDHRLGLRYEGVDQAGYGLASKMEPAPPEPDGPTADEMLDWLMDNGCEVVRQYGSTGQWFVRDCNDALQVVGKYSLDPRAAIRSAMKQEKP